MQGLASKEQELFAAFGAALAQSDVRRALAACEEFELLQVPQLAFPIYPWFRSSGHAGL